MGWLGRGLVAVYKGTVVSAALLWVCNRDPPLSWKALGMESVFYFGFCEKTP